MAEARQILFMHTEVVTALLKQQGIHEGIWGLHLRFGLKATNIGASNFDLVPAAIIPILEIGIQKFDEESNLSVDAAKVNPRAGAQPKTTARGKPVTRTKPR